MNDVVTFGLVSLVAAGILFAFWLVFKPHETSSTRAKEKSLANPATRKSQMASQEEPERKRQGSEGLRKEVAPAPEHLLKMSSPTHSLGTESPRDPFYTRWQIVAAEMGLREVESNKPDSNVVGEYRNHRIEVTYHSGTVFYDDSESARASFTIFRVGFENPFDVDLRLGPVASRQRIYPERIRIGSPGFEDEYVAGNKEDYIQSIFDSDICTQILKLRGRVPLFSMWTTKDGKGWQLSTETYSHIQEVKNDPDRFRLIIDVLVNLAEKIEKNPPLAIPLARALIQEQKEAKKDSQDEPVNRENVLSGAQGLKG